MRRILDVLTAGLYKLTGGTLYVVLMIVSRLCRIVARECDILSNAVGPDGANECAVAWLTSPGAAVEIAVRGTAVSSHVEDAMKDAIDNIFAAAHRDHVELSPAPSTSTDVPSAVPMLPRTPSTATG